MVGGDKMEVPNYFAHAVVKSELSKCCASKIEARNHNTKIFSLEIRASPLANDRLFKFVRMRFD